MVIGSEFTKVQLANFQLVAIELFQRENNTISGEQTLNLKVYYIPYINEISVVNMEEILDYSL